MKINKINNKDNDIFLKEGQQSNKFITLRDALYSSIAHTYKIDNYPGSDYNTPPENSKDPQLLKSNIINNLHRLFKYCINPLFREFGNSLELISVYRNKEVNNILGGVNNSQHIYGYAADIVLTDNIPTSTLFNWCKSNIPSYHHLIWEHPERGSYSEFSNHFSWVHISYIKEGNNKINSVSSVDQKIHKSYQDEHTFYLDNFTHGIVDANQELLEQY